MAKAKVCKDCRTEGIKTRRKADYPGPRCATHHRAVRKERRSASRERYVELTYNITEEQYQSIYKAQGGKCAICRRATGARKRLSVDHNHTCCSGAVSCGQCVRGLLCKPCNRDVLGHLRDSTDALERAIEYLKNPPALPYLKLD